MSLHVTLSATGVARYYFNLARDGERITDDEGVELQPNDLQHDVMLEWCKAFGRARGLISSRLARLVPGSHRRVG